MGRTDVLVGTQKRPSGCGGWKRGGPGENGWRAERRKKKKGASWSGLEIWPMADIEKRNIFFSIFQIFYRLQTHLSSNQI
jgi:hypothetical protein